MTDKFTIDDAAGEWKITLRGELDEPDGKALEAALREKLEGGTPPARALIDLNSVKQCTILGRASLTRVQELLARQRCRTAWMSSKPRFRGMAIWVVHMSGDPNAKSVANSAQAEAWLEAGVERLADLRKRAEAGLDAARRFKGGGS